MSQTMQSDVPALSVVTAIPAKKVLSLVGGFHVALGEHPIALPSNAQRLVALTALNERPVSRARAAALLWPESTEARAGASLRSALWRLRRAAPWLVSPGDDLEIADDVAVDVRDARAAARRLIEDGAEDAAVLEPFLLDLLPDWYEDWVIIERERYRQTRLHALESLCELLVSRRLYARAVDAGLAAVAGEPLRESAQRVLIRAHLAEGNVGEAVRQYRAYRQVLREELGVASSPELEQLIGVPVS